MDKLSPAMIRTIRESLKLSQEEAGELIGGGPRAFQKYEAGETEPAAAVENFLRVLYDAPELLNKLRPTNAKRLVLPTALAINDEHVARLSPVELQQTLRALIISEMSAFGSNSHSWCHAPTQINAPDDGEDARVEWTGEYTSFLPTSLVVFQAKASSLSAARCVQELATAKGVKRAVANVLEKKGTYVLVIARSLTQKGIDQRLAAMSAKLAELGFPHARDQLRIFSATQIADWANSYPAVAVGIREKLGDVGPFRSFQHWASSAEHANKLQDDHRLRLVAEELFTKLGAAGGIARVVGPSGIGKSRLLLEALQLPERGAEGLREMLIFADLQGAEQDYEIREAVQKLVDLSAEALIALENCPEDTHSRLASIVAQPRSRLRLLTIDMDVSDAPTPETFVLGRTADETVAKIVGELAPGLSEDQTRRVVRYAEGYPQLARLLAETANHNENLATQSDFRLSRLIVVGRDTHEPSLQVAKLISVFGAVRVEGDDDAQLRFLEQRFEAPKPSDFKRFCNELILRGSAQRRGGLVMITPKKVSLDLAHYQWNDWFNNNPTLIDVAFAHCPRSVTQTVARQFAKLDCFSSCRQIATELVGPGGAYDAVDTLLSESRLEIISSLAEVAPTAVAGSLDRLFLMMGYNRLGEIEGEARRYLVWCLSKLAFRRETFAVAAKLLFRLAVEENENYCNNATGDLRNLFPVFEATTEAGPEARQDIVSWALSLNDGRADKIVLSIIDKALETSMFSRTMGPETQGSAPPMVPWRPESKTAYDRYFQTWLKVLVRLAKRQGPLGRDARDALGRRFLGLFQIGLHREVSAAVKDVLRASSEVWHSAIDAFRQLLSQPDALEGESAQTAARLLELLRPTDERGILEITVSKPPYEHITDYNSKEHFEPESVARLAKRYAGHADELIPLLSTIVSGDQAHAYFFGKVLSENSREANDLAHETISALRKVDEKDGQNIAFLLGLLDGAKNDHEDLVEQILRVVELDDTLVWATPHLISVLGVTPSRLAMLIGLIKSRRVPASRLSHFGLGGSLSKLSICDLEQLIEALLITGDEYWRAAVETLVHYRYTHKDAFSQLQPSLRTLFATLTQETLPIGRASHDFAELATWVLDRGAQDELASFTAIQLARVIATASEVRLSSYDTNLRRIIRHLFKTFGAEVWPIISEAALANGHASFNIRNAIGRSFSTTDALPPVLDLPDTLLKSWCFANPDDGPQFLMAAVPLLSKSAENDEWTWHPFARWLIDNFGDQADLRDALWAAMRTFSWWGSTSQYYASYLGPLSELQTHPRDEMRLWAQKELTKLHRKIREELRSEEERHTLGDV